MGGFQWHNQRGVEGTGFVRALRSLLTAQLPTLQPRLASIIARDIDTSIKDLKVGEGKNLISIKLFSGFC